MQEIEQPSMVTLVPSRSASVRIRLSSLISPFRSSTLGFSFTVPPWLHFRTSCQCRIL